MRALQFAEYGGPEVLVWTEVPEVHAGPGTVRVAVRAASLNPFDAKVRSGAMRDQIPLTLPAGSGLDAAGVVDEIGDGVTGVNLGDEILGLGDATHAEHAVLRAWVPRTAATSWAEAASCGIAGETAVRTLSLLAVERGTRLLVDGASGGVGSIAVQAAVARGAVVFASAAERNHAYLRQLGATPVLYGDGVTDRVREAVGGPLDAVLDVAGRTSAADLVTLVDHPSAVLSIANFDAPAVGARVTSSGGDPMPALTEIAGLLADGQLHVATETFALPDGAAAYRRLAEGGVRGKIALVL